MNHLLKPYLKKISLVFFDDILIYYITWYKHIHYVNRIFHFLQDHKLFVKLSKCSFGMEEVEYLGHIVGCDGVRVDLKKIQAMQYWPYPKTLKILRGFLGLKGYIANLSAIMDVMHSPSLILWRKNHSYGLTQCNRLSWLSNRPYAPLQYWPYSKECQNLVHFVKQIIDGNH